MIEVQSHVKQLVKGTHKEQHDSVFVVELEQDVCVLLHGLVALGSAGDGGIHVKVVRGQVEGDQELPKDEPIGVEPGQKHNQRARRASVGDHVQNRAERCALVVFSGSVAVKGVQETRC